MTVGNVLVYRDEKFGVHRYWEIVGVYLGSLVEESLIELRSISEKPGHDGEILRPTTFVPECLTRNLEERTMESLFGAGK
jgi:hypothetical protein